MLFKGSYSYKLRDKTVNHITTIPIKDENDPRIDNFLKSAFQWHNRPEFKMNFKVVSG